jgi:hypothetical protein
VNDPPQIGSLQSVPTLVINPETGLQVSIDMDSLVPIVAPNSSKCMSLSSSSDAYAETCAPQNRKFISIDEDTIFTMTPNLLWIEDVDSKEAIGAKLVYHSFYLIY